MTGETSPPVQGPISLAAPFIGAASLSHVELAARARVRRLQTTPPAHGRVALRSPRQRVYRNVNDPSIDARILVQQELRIYRILHSGPLSSCLSR
ncbi:hypothetical protein ACRE_024430 [Hapsidospora chrysogenum ATCC 11550]|uniref:Uncharacterized protein n=1 Tax=Hapsidospora chrysogenum (strain ATCC 11550 / CBS 779.69 / DSM 880 / IAM 14645 / JCM 23072 / IMI 49137) TaxID=857340 RepID=A0A086TBH6_HAPC1|nr:hypothetical protein ACRE_024430 [Hapsidospora chrysogenum ATCC 11550]